MTTKEKVDFLQKYMRKWHLKWRKIHSDNIVGFRIGKKIHDNIESREISIIFQLKNKREKKMVKEENIIPDHFKIKFPDKKFRIIKTDIEETGRFDFHIGAASSVQSSYSSKFGSAGLFVKDSSDKIYMVTNYHVVAEDFMNDNRFYYHRSPDQTANDVKIYNDRETINGRFEIGAMTHEIDVSFTEIFIEPNGQLNNFPDLNRISGKYAGRPLPNALIGKPVKVYSFYNQNGALSQINSVSSVLYTSNPEIYFEDIIQISPKVTQGGDSGGALLTKTNAILGIIVGGDNNYSYAIPFYKITDFKNVTII